MNDVDKHLKSFCRNRLPVRYNPNAGKPVQWKAFLSQLLQEEDVLTLQEFFGYCLIPSTKGQKMLLLTGKGGEGKSRVGVVLQALLGCNLKTGSIAKVEISPFARADLQNMLVMMDNALSPLAQKTVINYLKQNSRQYNLEYTNKISIGDGRFARGFWGIRLLKK